MIRSAHECHIVGERGSDRGRAGAGSGQGTLMRAQALSEPRHTALLGCDVTDLKMCPMVRTEQNNRALR